MNKETDIKDIYDERSITKFDTNTGIRKKLGMYLNERNLSNF